jgi:SHS2 domain-containing protein
MQPFKQLDHPSDIGLEVFGQDQKALFENAALGLFSLMADLGAVEAKEDFALKVEGDDAESLLVNWLNELIFYQDSKKVLLKKFKIKKLSSRKLEAVASGEKIDLAKHSIYRPVKAATYNQLQISKNQARIIFDV